MADRAELGRKEKEQLAEDVVRKIDGIDVPSAVIHCHYRKEYRIALAAVNAALAGARLAAEPPRMTADALEAIAAQVRNTPSYKQGVNDEHKSHVEFEMELYATLVDPVLDEPIKEAELRKQLLESARWYRQHVEDLENQLNALARVPDHPPADEQREKMRSLLMKHFSNKLSMDEIGDCIYDAFPAGASATPAPSEEVLVIEAYKFTDAAMKVLQCKFGCAMLTYSGCALVKGQSCYCECHKVWATFDEMCHTASRAGTP